MIRKATPNDANFIAVGILAAERGIHKIGIWDVYLGETIESMTNQSTSLATKALQRVVTTATSCLYHFSQFLIYEVDGGPVGCACGYLHPEKSLLQTMTFLGQAMQGLAGWEESHCVCAKERLDFLDDCFPADVAFDGKWIIEAVYVDDNFRRKGIASKLVRAVAEMGSQVSDDVLIGVAVGNDGSMSCYEQIGFSRVGSVPSSKECEQVLGGCSGFSYLEKKTKTQAYN